MSIKKICQVWKMFAIQKSEVCLGNISGIEQEEYNNTTEIQGKYISKYFTSIYATYLCEISN